MELLAALLPVAAFGLIWRLTTRHRPQLGLSRLSRRGTFVVAFAGFQIVLWGFTEVLSIGNHLTQVTMTWAWIAFVVVVSVPLVRAGDADRLIGGSRSWSPAEARRWIRRQPLGVLIPSVSIGVIVVALGTAVALYPPNNGDSLVYHLTRVAHWAQDQSVRHFATHYTAQIELAPLDEFNLLNLHLLTGTDRLDGFVQLAAFVVCVCGASELARLLGAAATVQAAAALVCASIPSVLLEAASTQNNLFAASIGMAMVVLVLGGDLLRSRVVAGLVGLSAGLAYLAKGTLLALIGPVVIVLVIQLIAASARSTGWPATLRRTAVSGLIAISLAAAIAAPFLKRNHDLFGGISGPVTESTLNTEFGLRPMSANLIRGVAVNFRIGDGDGDPKALISRAVLTGLRELHGLLGVPQDDSRYWIGNEFDAFAIQDYREAERHEDFGANPWHVILLTLTGGTFLIAFIRGRSGVMMPLLIAVGLCLGYMAFTMTVRWSVFVTRYYSPQLVLWAPLIALALARSHHLVRQIVLVFLVIAALPLVLDNSLRSLRHLRIDYASDLGPYLVSDAAGSDFVAVRDAIVESGCRRVGIGNWILAEYPIWAGLDRANWGGRIEHINVTNESGALEDDEYSPCAVIRVADGTSPPDDERWVEVQHGALVLALDADRVAAS